MATATPDTLTYAPPGAPTVAGNEEPHAIAGESPAGATLPRTGETLPQPEPHGALVFRETPARVAVAPRVRSALRIGASR